MVIGCWMAAAVVAIGRWLVVGGGSSGMAERVAEAKTLTKNSSSCVMLEARELGSTALVNSPLAHRRRPKRQATLIKISEETAAF